MENYIMLDGVKIELTEEQIKTLRGASEKKKSPFERVERGEDYYVISDCFDVVTATECNDKCDDKWHKVANYCTDKKLMEQRALHEKLSRLLWRFSMENREELPKSIYKWWIRKHYDDDEYDVDCNEYFGEMTMFDEEKVARRAIEEIVKPFVKEHPDFRWGY